MSNKNGDKSRFNRQRKHKIALRQRVVQQVPKPGGQSAGQGTSAGSTTKRRAS